MRKLQQFFKHTNSKEKHEKATWVMLHPHGSWLKRASLMEHFVTLLLCFFCTAIYSLKAALLHVNKSVSFQSWGLPEAGEEKKKNPQQEDKAAYRQKRGGEINNQSTSSSTANGRSAWDGKVLSCKPRGVVGLQDRGSPCLSYNMWILANILLT